MNTINKGITAPKGFLAAGIHAGLKKKKMDMTAIYSEYPCEFAGVFTKNIVKAAPVLWDMSRLKESCKIKGVIVNSGNANACTGRQGLEDVKTMANIYAQEMNINIKEVLVASTGVIGVNMPMDRIGLGIKKVSSLLAKGEEVDNNAVLGIMTTDTFPKYKSVIIEIDGKQVTISGMIKGSGMIHPNMGTMLGFITTDANVSSELLQEMLKEITEETYNMISVDGDTSTNDTVVVLANGASGINEITKNSNGYKEFKEALFYINSELSQLVVKDGEGASKFIEVKVCGIKNKADAKKMAKSVITSNLVKTAFYGEDANWGRVLCALGYSGVEFNQSYVDIVYESNAGKIDLMIKGVPQIFDEEKALKILKEKEIFVTANFNSGSEEAKAWGCDLSHEYVHINGDYRS